MKNITRTVLLMGIIVAGLVTPADAQEKKPALNHMALSVYNLQKSTVFYRDVLQLDTVPEPFHDGKHTWLKIGPGSYMHLIEGAPEIREHDMATHTCFSVPSVTDFIARLDQFGVPYSNWQGEKQQVTIRVDGIKQIYLQDPDGYWIEINDDY
ncbi:VOC family protein [Parapedobacter indicus]|uniref:Lactoylglutathione lyase n=2 Tax=Parapedobacter indicus TaxID=1477437 RepID=A0A1I3T5T9_9SPHI|nr:VOC family protein [Parapedobacter indicus]PPK99630.1 lactoylglutathione lyase [Parapedobacter indicus]SFJ65990.1 lactoylglutathione lyase [Parapedobacter indicus]